MDRSTLQTVEAARTVEAQRLGADRAAQRAQHAAAKTVAKPQPKLVDTGRTQRVGDWSCRTWNATLQGRVVAEHCVVPVAKLGGGQDLDGALKSFGAFWRQVAPYYPGLEDSGGALAQAYERMKGVPVRTKTFVGGKPQEITTVTRVRAESLGTPMFQVPGGYEQKSVVHEAQSR